MAASFCAPRCSASETGRTGKTKKAVTDAVGLVRAAASFMLRSAVHRKRPNRENKKGRRRYGGPCAEGSIFYASQCSASETAGRGKQKRPSQMRRPLAEGYCFHNKPTAKIIKSDQIASKNCIIFNICYIFTAQRRILSSIVLNSSSERSSFCLWKSTSLSLLMGSRWIWA